jgi:hypothetical protein
MVLFNPVDQSVPSLEFMVFGPDWLAERAALALRLDPDVQMRFHFSLLRVNTTLGGKHGKM